jgi:acyl-CoA thioester hydrolase
MFVHTFHKRIRYGETDQMGYFYYGNYAQLYEIGRSEAIRSLNISYRELESELRIMMPVLYTESRFKGPILYDELISIKTILKEMPTKLIHFDHEIYNESGELIHTGSVKLFFIDMDTQKRISAPKYLTEKLKPFF